MEIKIQNAKKRNVKFLYNLRNNPVTRKMFVNVDFLNYKDHRIWFNKALKKSNPKIFIAYKKKGNKEIGYVRFYRKDLFTEVSICVSKKYRKKKLSKSILDLSEKKIKYNTIFLAKVKKNNLMSEKLFISQNYQKLRSSKNISFYIKTHINEKNTLKYLKTIDQMENVRSKNNVNWMNILRESFKNSPEISSKILKKIYLDDKKISNLAKRLTK